MYTNVWYVAERSDNLQDEPKRVRMLGRDFVLFRDDQGKAVCLSNVCPHRGANIAAGKCHSDGTVSCPFHGWRFNADGQCIMIPSQHPQSNVVPRAKLESYPTQEKYGLIWTFLGDEPEQAAPLPEMTEYGDSNWRSLTFEDVWHTNYHWAKSTNLDHVHLAVVHGIMHQSEENPFRPPDHEVTLTDYGFRTEIRTLVERSSASWNKGKENKKRTVSKMRFFVSGFTLSVNIALGGEKEGMNTVFYESSTPIDEQTTQMRWTFFRNFMTDPKHDEEYLARNLKNIFEDKAIGEDIVPKAAPYAPSSHAIYVDREDRVARAYWSIMQGMRNKGWQIDNRRLKDLEKDNYYRVIPSPARKGSAEQWVFDTVPRLAPDQSAAAAAE